MRSMPGPDYYRRQAQICASLALANRDPSVIGRYNAMALEHLAKAEELEPPSRHLPPLAVGENGSDMDSD